MFSCLRTTVDGGHEFYFQAPPVDRYNVQAHGWSSSRTTSDWTDLIDAVEAAGAAAILNFHRVGPASLSSSLDISAADFETIVAHAAGAGVNVVTMSGLLTA